MKKKIILAVTVIACMVCSIGATSCTYAEDTNLEYSYSIDNSETISLKGSTAQSNSANVDVKNSTITIKSAGTYKITGTLNNGQIIVNAGKDDTVTLILDNANINCSTSAPIYSQQSGTTVVYLADKSTNTLTDTAKNVEKENSAIYAQDNLVIAGTGSLKITANGNDGIKSKDDLVIENVTINITSDNDGIQGKDSLTVKNGKITITSGADGIKSNNDKSEEKGYILIDGGTFNITSGEDAIQAETNLTINGGDFTVISGGGNEKSTKTHNEGFGGGPRPDGDKGEGITPPDDNGERPEPPEMKNGQLPEMPENNNAEKKNDNEKKEENTETTSEEESVSTKGLKAGGNLTITSGTFNLDCADDTLHAGGVIKISDGKITALSGDYGIHSDTELTITGGTIDIQKSYEGLEGVNINIEGGDISIVASDDGINVNDSNGLLNITGGTTYVNARGDGLDSNGSINITGGTVLVDGPTSNGDGALDYDHTATITGGTLVAAGSSGMVQAITANDNKSTLNLYFTETQKANTLISITDESGKLICVYKPTKDFQNIVISNSNILKNKKYTVSVGGTITGECANGYYSSGTITDAEKLCTFTPTSNITSITDTGEVRAERGTDGGFGGPRGENRENNGVIKNKEVKENSTETTTNQAK